LVIAVLKSKKEMDSMKKLFFAFVAAVAILATLSVEAKPKRPSGANTVTAVDTTAKTVTIHSGKDDILTYHLTGVTQITVNGESATIDKIRVGMRADISVGGDKTTLTKIDLTGTETPASPKKKKKK
jgi:Cu/Ag efflux protein CusF